MRTIVTLSYLDIFDGPIPAMQELLFGLSSEGIITSLSIINAQLYADRSPKKQLSILEDLLEGEDTRLFSSVVQKSNEVTSKYTSVDYAFFSTRYSLAFIHHELINYRKGKLISCQADRLNFFKAYLIIAEQVNEPYVIQDETSNDQLLFPIQKRIWPLLIIQFSTDSHVNILTEIARAIMLLNHFESNLKYKQYHEIFLKKIGKVSSWDYVIGLVMLLAQGSDIYKKNDNLNFPWRIANTPEYDSLFEAMSLDQQEYVSDVNKHKAFIGVKQKPLFKSNGDFLVLSWNFVASKVYESLVFDFYNFSGINKQPEFNEFLRFKQYISQEVVERIMLKTILKAVFNGKGNVLLFDDERKQGFPDAYVRSGKYIYLFEIKDALFSAKVIQDGSYNAVKVEIDKKFNTDKKGIAQLVKHIAHLEKNHFEPRSFEELNLKRRNLVIFPVVLYTDMQFGMPGIGQYLSTEFEKRMHKDLTKTFKTIKPLTMLNLSFFTDNMDLVTGENKHSLKHIILCYQRTLKKRNSNKLTSNPVDNSILMNESIEQYFIATFRQKTNQPNRTYIDGIKAAMKLTENLS
ncbi:MAG: hypothetical protein JNJ75_10560 [Cyclobacteriaceae bacterium]|nr:hypothetical protein [Cyclobacteriaceae bacterium]